MLPRDKDLELGFSLIGVLLPLTLVLPFIAGEEEVEDELVDGK